MPTSTCSSSITCAAMPTSLRRRRKRCMRSSRIRMPGMAGCVADGARSLPDASDVLGWRRRRCACGRTRICRSVRVGAEVRRPRTEVSVRFDGRRFRFRPGRAPAGGARRAAVPIPRSERFDFNLSPIAPRRAMRPARSRACPSTSISMLRRRRRRAERDLADMPELDLGADHRGAHVGAGDAADDRGQDDFLGDDAVATKIDLARAYLDMGDADGARSMLEEVVSEGSEAQKSEAKRLLTEIK
ncbi:MAG: hypothetical protein IPH50_10225 [Rhodanobacteraceae bacterium]|nr:hypothetical protein [Rhodanobacteraceae bacterium]